MGTTELESAAYWLSWLRVMGTVSAFLVAIGVAGEFLKDFLARPYEEIMERARQVEMGQLKNAAAVAQLEQERLRADNIKLEALIVGRRFTAEQVSNIGDSLKRFAGRQMFVSSYAGDAEAARLGLQIKEALSRAGIHVANELGRTTAASGGVIFGVTVSGPESDKDLMDTVAESLRTLGHVEAVGYVVVPTMRIGPALTGIMVALRPLPTSP